MKRILNPEDNAPLDLANLVSRGFTVAEARKQLGYVLPEEATEEEAPAPEEPVAEAPVKKAPPAPAKKPTAKKSGTDGL